MVSVVIRTRRRADACHASQQGFTLVEVIVAIVLIALLMAGLASVLGASIRTERSAKERQTAANLAEAALESMRALPYATLALGNNLADMASDATSPFLGSANIYGSGPYKLLSATGETVVTRASGAPAPLAATATSAVNGTDYSVRTYVSIPSGATTTTQLHVSAVVTWRSAANAGAVRRYVAQTTASSDVGCESAATRPFAGPCANFFAAAASTGMLTVSVAPSVDAPNALTDPTVKWSAPSVQSLAQSEQTVYTSALLKAPWVGASTSGEPSSPYSDLAAKADNDPSGSAALTSQPTPQVAVSVAGSAGSLSYSLVPAGSASLLANVFGSGCPIAGVTGSVTPLSTPCSGGSGQSAAGDIVATLPDLSTATLAHVSPGYTANATSAFSPASLSNICTATASTAGCNGARAARTVPAIALALIPATSSFVASLSGTTESLWVEAGPGSQQHTFNRSSVPQLTWRSTASTTLPPIALDGSAAAAAAVAALPVSTFALPGGGTLTVTPTLSTGSPTNPSSVVCTAACKNQVTQPSYLSGSIRYAISSAAGLTLASYVINVDVGGLQASASFQGAPSAN
ncbi:MAG: type IV pilus modification PilV family protein [Actinomycetales bacterium]